MRCWFLGCKASPPPFDPENPQWRYPQHQDRPTTVLILIQKAVVTDLINPSARVIQAYGLGSTLGGVESFAVLNGGSAQEQSSPLSAATTGGLQMYRYLPSWPRYIEFRGDLPQVCKGIKPYPTIYKLLSPDTSKSRLSIESCVYAVPCKLGEGLAGRAITLEVEFPLR
ncbi:hypothetical protein BDN72DRAFT_842886 [Pluteus cervinus]|uniref:Uncharacterized protein n=1 Tax=Pluteus cervinus TaxID=181527 RepID=A0ACD3APS4_9AGAR|nr:hypothetical protein BDN72DRAFT_842886 [Pluteus cervinus]